LSCEVLVPKYLADPEKSFEAEFAGAMVHSPEKVMKSLLLNVSQVRGMADLKRVFAKMESVG